MQIQEQKTSLTSKLMQKLFGSDTAQTVKVANEIKAITKSGEEFLARAIKLFNRKNDLEVAYENDSDALDGRGSGWGTLSFMSGFGAVLVAVGAVLTAPYGLGVAAALLASPLALGGIAALGVLTVTSAVKQYQVGTAMEKISQGVESAHSEATATLKTEIEAMQISLVEKTPDVREQFNRAYEVSLKKTQIFENKIAAENEAEALEDLADAKRAQANATVAAGVIIASARR